MKKYEKKKVKGMCLDCIEIRPMQGRGLCSRCYHVRRSDGTLHDLPLRPLVIERYEEFLMVRKDTTSVKVIAERMGVTSRTIDRYMAHLSGKNKIKSLQEVGL